MIIIPIIGFAFIIWLIVYVHLQEKKVRKQIFSNIRKRKRTVKLSNVN